MSKELIGGNGNIVGSWRCFERLNKEHFVENLMREPQNTEYYDCLRDTASRIRDTAEEIFEDLRKHIGIIRYIPKEDRENLRRFCWDCMISVKSPRIAVADAVTACPF